MGTATLWVALAEKAYAEANGLGLVQTNHVSLNSYDALNDGDPAWALQAITGNPATDYSINPTNIASAWNAGQLIVLCARPRRPAPTSWRTTATPSSATTRRAASRSSCSTRGAPTPRGGRRPPASTGTKYGLFTANAAFISQNFDQQSIDTGASDGNAVDQAVEELTELAALGKLNDPSGLIRPFRQANTA